MNEIEVRDKLVDDGVAGGRIYRGLAPDNVVYPYVRFFLSKVPLTQDLQENTSYRNEFQFQIYGESFLDAKNTLIALQNSMRPIGRETYCQEDEYPDPDTGNSRIINEWFVNEFN